MARFEVAHMHLLKAGLVELLAEEHEHMQAIRPGSVTAFLMLLGELAEFIRELVHRGPPVHVRVSTPSRVRSVRGCHAWPLRQASAAARAVSRPPLSCAQTPHLWARP